MTGRPPLKVFVSSTRVDLADVREAVRQKLIALGLVPLAMETFGAAPADAVTVSTEHVAECDLFVGIYAFRYGYTPVEGGTSVTEQEYEAAGRHGKRRLCYLASDALRPATSDESEAKLKRLESFKHRIGRQLVREAFASAVALSESLGNDLFRLLGGEPLGYAFEDVWARWMAFEVAERERLFRYELAGRSPVAPSPLESDWQTFVAKPGWHDTVAHEIRAARSNAEQFPELALLVSALDAVVLDTDYPTLRGSLARLAKARWEEKVQRLADSLPAQGREAAGEKYQQTLHDLRAALARLQRHSERPAYSRIFAVMGSLGAGKTHFIAQLLAETGQMAAPTERPYLVLPLAREAGTEDMQECVMAGIRRATGLDWRGLEEFERFLARVTAGRPAGRPLKLVVAIDDVQRWLLEGASPSDDVSRFTEVVGRLSKVRPLHWLVTLEQTSYPRLPRGSAADVWSDYGEPTSSSGPARVGPWVALDDLNESKQLGLSIIRHHAGEGVDLALDRGARAETARRWLSQPFLAWILVDLRSAGPALDSLVDLNYIEFASRFWEVRRVAVPSAEVAPDDLDVASALLARLAFETGLTPPLTDVLNRITHLAANVSELRERPRASAAVRALERAQLLHIEAVPESALAGVPIDRVTFRFESFWAWRLALEVIQKPVFEAGTPEEIASELEEATGTFVVSPELRQALLVFWVLLFEQREKARRAPRDRIEAVMVAVLQSARLPRSAVWLAGPKGSQDLQRALASLALRLPGLRIEVDGRDPEILFALMYLAREVSSNALDPPSRLQIVRAWYGAIASTGLSDYFLYLATRVFHSASSDEAVLACMHQLAGCEPLEMTERLAELAVRALVDTGPGEDRTAELQSHVLGAIVEYLRRVPADVVQAARQSNRQAYWQWVITQTCWWLVRAAALEAHEIFRQAGWYNGRQLGLPLAVATRLRSEANLALGSWYRGLREPPRRLGYQQLVDRLARSPHRAERERAFFLVRHTSHVHGRGRPAVVDKAFEKTLEILSADRALTGVMAAYPTSVRPGD